MKLLYGISRPSRPNDMSDIASCSVVQLLEGGANGVAQRRCYVRMMCLRMRPYKWVRTMMDIYEVTEDRTIKKVMYCCEYKGKGHSEWKWGQWWLKGWMRKGKWDFTRIAVTVASLYKPIVTLRCFVLVFVSLTQQTAGIKKTFFKKRK